MPSNKSAQSAKGNNSDGGGGSYKGNNAYVKESWGSQSNFMNSYGLKSKVYSCMSGDITTNSAVSSDSDHQEAKAIIQGFRDVDAQQKGDGQSQRK